MFLLQYVIYCQYLTRGEIMSSFSFANYPLMSPDISGGVELLVLPASTTSISRAFNLTSLDSIHGVFITFVGTRIGLVPADVTIQIQQATTPDALDANWNDIGTAANVGVAGDIVTPEAFNLVVGVYPTYAESLMPYLRMKVITAADGAVTFTKMFRSTRGRG
jgi:hypothetical protein